MAAACAASSLLLFAILCLSLSCSAASASAIDVHQLCPNILTLSSLQASPPPNTTLRVLVPWKVGFDQFVKFRNDTCILDGFSVRVFESALRYMPHPMAYRYVLYGDGDETPVYEDMVDLVQNKTVDAVVADLTITSERWDKVGFTVPYLASSLVMVTPFKYGSTGTYVDLLKPFSWQLWVTLLSAFVMTGLALYVLEHKNPDFSNALMKTVGKDQGSSHGGSSKQGHTVMPNELATSNSSPVSTPRLPSQSPDIELTQQVSENTVQTPLQEDLNTVPTHDIASSQDTVPAPPIYGQVSRKRRIVNAYWFAALCVFQAQQESVRTHLGRTVTVIWLFMMLIFNSSYTASLAALFSAQKIIPTIPSFQALLEDTNISIGYQEGSFMANYMKTLNLQSHVSKNFTSETQYAQALREGNLNGVGAVLDELPYTQILLQFECDLTTSSDIKDQLPDFGGFGFAFQKGDPLIQEFSNMILQMGEDGTLENLKNGWNIGETDRTGCSSDGEPSHLRLRSTGGFFAIIALVYLFCLIARTCTWFMKAPKKDLNLPHFLPCSQINSTISGRDTSLSRRSNRIHNEDKFDQDLEQNRETAQSSDDGNQDDQDLE